MQLVPLGRPLRVHVAAMETQQIWVNTEGGRLYAKRWNIGTRTAGSDAPIVLFHDSLGCVEVWRDFPDRLCAASQRDVIAYDRLGFGKSDARSGTLDAQFVVAEATGDFARVREHFGIDSFLALGHSVGGGMAVACAAHYASACRALITESAQAFLEDRTVAGIRDAQMLFQQPGQLDRLGKYHGDKAEWVLHAWIDTWLSPEFSSWNLDEQLRRVRCPALAIHGDNDEFGSPRHAERIGSLIGAGATIMILEECGHVPRREKPEAVLTAIIDWMMSAI